MNIQIAIDGASKGNGKANCVSSGGVVIRNLSTGDFFSDAKIEDGSTSQRGELNGLLFALKYVQKLSNGDDVQIITDSEYIFNTITKEWYLRWANNGWKTSSGDAVKNKDLWLEISSLYESRKAEVNFYHIKGHILPDGGKLILRELNTDGPGHVFNTFYEKFDMYRLSKSEEISKAQVLSKINNGTELSDNVLKTFVALNSTVDRIATAALIDYVD